MLNLFKRKYGETDCCRYCKFASQKGDEIYMCKYKGEVKASGVCRKYKFNPFAHRTPRLRSLDTTMFDPLDFELESD